MMRFATPNAVDLVLQQTLAWRVAIVEGCYAPSDRNIAADGTTEAPIRALSRHYAADLGERSRIEGRYCMPGLKHPSLS